MERNTANKTRPSAAAGPHTTAKTFANGQASFPCTHEANAERACVRNSKYCVVVHRGRHKVCLYLFFGKNEKKSRWNSTQKFSNTVQISESIKC